MLEANEILCFAILPFGFATIRSEKYLRIAQCARTKSISGNKLQGESSRAKFLSRADSLLSVKISGATCDHLQREKQTNNINRLYNLATKRRLVNSPLVQKPRDVLRRLP